MHTFGGAGPLAFDLGVLIPGIQWAEAKPIPLKMPICTTVRTIAMDFQCLSDTYLIRWLGNQTS